MKDNIFFLNGFWKIYYYLLNEFKRCKYMLFMVKWTNNDILVKEKCEKY